jgi:hypothetical protein
MKTVNLNLSQGDAFFRFTLEVESTNAKVLSVLFTETLLKFHQRYSKYCKGKTKSYNLKFGKPFTLQAYIEGVKGENGTFYHETSNFFLNVENSSGGMEVTHRLTKADNTKVGMAYFMEDWMNDIFDGRRASNMEDVLKQYTNTTCEECVETTISEKF